MTSLVASTRHLLGRRDTRPVMVAAAAAPSSNGDPNLTWENPGQAQTDRDPVACLSWQDARAYGFPRRQDVPIEGGVYVVDFRAIYTSRQKSPAFDRFFS